MRAFLLTLSALLGLSVFSQPVKTSKSVTRPKLVVGIVIDQMRWDFLYRYYDRYGEGGFKRLMNQGFRCENTMIPYTPSYTAAGHASIYTGSVPAVNGIMGNYWYQRELGRNVYCTDDSTVTPVGTSTKAGKMSPRNLWTTTITDELRLASNFRSKVIGIAFKDRGSILPAGHAANAAYWFDDSTGGFITSSYYMSRLPEWMQSFNAKRLPDQYLNGNWNTLYPINSYTGSSGDSAAYEAVLPGEDNTFPHETSRIARNKYNSFRYTPFAMSFTFQAAEAAVTAEKLGGSGETDFLALSFSSTDYIGHEFGPNSIEVEDAYLRLDRDLAAFLQFLDRSVGKGQYLVFLTSDHGVSHVPGFLREHSIPAGSYDDAEIARQINLKIEAQFGLKKAISQVINYQVYFDHSLVNNNNQAAVTAFTIKELLQFPFIANAFELSGIMSAPIPGRLREMLANGYNQKLSGDIQFNYKPQWFDGGARGTSHGVWYAYDTHIPLIFYGWNIAKGSSNREIYMTDIAPTIAALLKIQMPSGSIGKVIGEVVGGDQSAGAKRN
ncbi:MAG TPA: alkaline phosphatase PafA [Chitinophagaceae bacterium]